MNLVLDPEYQRNLRRAFIRRSLPPALESMVWAYAFGKPRQTDESQVDSGPSELRVTVVPSRVFDPRTGECIYDPLKEARKAKERAGLPVGEDTDPFTTIQARDGVSQSDE